MASIIDRQQSILQSNVTERIQQVQQQHPDQQQRYFDIQLSQERRKMLHKVNAFEEIDRAKVGKDGGKGQQQDRQQKNETKPPAPSGAASTEEQQLGHIDIKV